MKNLKTIQYSIGFLLLLFSIKNGYAQENVPDDFVANIFGNTILINTQTTETVAKGAFEIGIQHRFDEIDLNDFGNSVVENFLGLDGSANIRLSFAYALSDNFQLSIGRTKIDKVVDLGAKYRLVRQKETWPKYSATLYFNTGISTVDFPESGPGEFFSNGKTPFEYEFSHRFSYNAQLLLSKKIGEKLSIELNPTFIFKNLVPQGYDNFVVATTIGGRYKTGFKSYLIFESAIKFNNRLNDYTDPLSIGYEMTTAGHTFQIFFSSSNQILEQSLFFSDPLDYTDGKFMIGFNIKRTFWH